MYPVNVLKIYPQDIGQANFMIMCRNQEVGWIKPEGIILPGRTHLAKSSLVLKCCQVDKKLAFISEENGIKMTVSTGSKVESITKFALI